MSSKASQVIVLAEDRAQQDFARHYLKLTGLAIRQLRFQDLPGSRGCGEQWVRKHYAAQVQAFRNRSARAETALIVMIDGDPDLRERQLSDELSQQGAHHRRPNEKVVHLVSNRSIETWIRYLAGAGPVDEDTDYKAPGLLAHTRTATERLYQLSRPNASFPADLPASLRRAITELRRL